jgi:hypothetical protein
VTTGPGYDVREEPESASEPAQLHFDFCLMAKRIPAEPSPFHDA